VHTTHFWYILQPDGTLSDKIFEGKLASRSTQNYTEAHVGNITIETQALDFLESASFTMIIIQCVTLWGSINTITVCIKFEDNAIVSKYRYKPIT
jgi:hypothetical protein